MLPSLQILKNVKTWLCAVFVALCVGLTIAPSPAAAHADDDWCWNDPSIDKELCRKLAKLDSANPKNLQSTSIGDLSVEPASFATTFPRYIKLGFQHILPMGLDHILFVLALFLASRRVRPLLIQISLFTLAHTITLGLAATGWVNLPSRPVEILIAASIAYVALENIVFKDMTRWRPLVVFVFGLVHGLGFASMFLQLGVPQGQALTSLIGFNLGVEIGQLVVIALAFIPALYLRRLFDREAVPQLYHRSFVIPVSIFIGIVGLLWTIERAMPYFGYEFIFEIGPQLLGLLLIGLTVLAAPLVQQTYRTEGVSGIFTRAYVVPAAIIFGLITVIWMAPALISVFTA